jgi:hypothetical protein
MATNRLATIAIAIAMGAHAPGVVRAQAEPPRTAPLFAGTALPEPPRQHELWSPPKSELPAPVVSAAETLFEQGLADPRGLPYREVEVGVGTVWGSFGVARVHAWLMPQNDPSGQRLAVCWNGLVTPVVSTGRDADLRADVAALLKAAAAARAKHAAEYPEIPYLHGVNADNDAAAVSHESLYPLKACLLLRLGEGDAAARMWSAWRAGVPNDGDGEVERDPYLELARDWVWSRFNRAMLAHMRGDDRLALIDARAVASARDAVTAEATRRGVPRPPAYSSREGEVVPYFEFLDQLPALVADQERRAAEGPAANDAERASKSARLIARLDEVAARQDGQPGGVDVRSDPVVKELLAEGESAVDALVDVVERDDRLTRSVRFGRNFHYGRHVLSVGEAAYTILRAILHASFDEIEEDGDERAQLRARAAAIRGYWRTYGAVAPEERWYRTLADDDAGAEQWLDAAANVAGRAGYEPYAGEWRTEPFRRQTAPSPVRGEGLRRKSNPSVADLMRRRAIALLPRPKDPNASYPVYRATAMALMLARWDPSAAGPTLAEAFAATKAAMAAEHLSDPSSYAGYVAALTDARVLAGDERAIAEYGEWLRALEPARAGTWASHAFEPLWRFPDNADAAALADAVLNGDTKWNPLFRPMADGGGTGGRDMLASGLLALPAMKRHVLRELGDTRTAAKTVVRSPHSVEVKFGESWSTWANAPEDVRLSMGDEGELRQCDLYAWALSGVHGMPRFEIFWPLAERDAAIAACARVVGRYAVRATDDDTWVRIAFEPLDRPATPADVDEGRAIFSLDGAARVVRLDRYPKGAIWKAKPLGEGYGRIWQAEEAMEGGRWQRYYGFVGQHEIVRVRAEEVEILPD